MPSLEERIVSDIVSYIQQSGAEFSSWYVGIAADARSTLFTEHGVDEGGGEWIFENAMTESCAKRIGQQLIESYKLKGAVGTTAYSTTSVYVYKITPSTRQ